MSTISKDSTEYRRARKLQMDGQHAVQRVSGVQRSHFRPLEEVNPLFVPPDTPDHGSVHTNG